MKLEEAVIRKLKETQHILCTVESCTGGLIAHLLTNISGSSEVFWGSSVVYDNSAKEELGVPAALIQSDGAVSPRVAQDLAEKGLNRMQKILEHADSFALLKPRGLVCIVTTGIAGPGGGSPQKPVGLCYVGLAISNKPTLVKKIQASASLDRIQTKTEFAQSALELLQSSL